VPRAENQLAILDIKALCSAGPLCRSCSSNA
jgi:hypothetical protein